MAGPQGSTPWDRRAKAEADQGGLRVWHGRNTLSTLFGTLLLAQRAHGRLKTHPQALSQFGLSGDSPPRSSTSSHWDPTAHPNREPSEKPYN